MVGIQSARITSPIPYKGLPKHNLQQRYKVNRKTGLAIYFSAMSDTRAIEEGKKILGLPRDAKIQQFRAANGVSIVRVHDNVSIYPKRRN